MNGKVKFYYTWWFIALCFITVYLSPLGLLLLILRCWQLHKEVARYERDIDSLKADARAEAQVILEKARDKEERLDAREQQIQEKYDYVKKQEKTAEEIVNQAQIKADALLDDATRKLRNLKGTIEALKNERDGYGDEYLVPGRTLLDDLADHFGFTNASEEFKKAKANSKALVKNGAAAVCDYVEENRKKTACAFVIDAFNGKVDTAISKIKGGENYGKCRQAIQDAFMLVNTNGEAFRNARITDEYFASRQEELRWAAVLLELKKKEQEEQREIRERMREEAKAQAEFERAKAQAQKEEARIRAAREKMEEALKTATDAQKAKYEAQIQALSEKLKAAEENSKRAQSMAELTKAGHVYVISNIGSFGENVVKIGMTRRLDPEDRISELSNASVPFPFDIHAMIYSENAPDLENKLHDVFDQRRVNMVNPRKEFFRVPLSEIQAEVEKLGLKVQFTLLARAEEYRESLRLKTPLN